MNAKEGVAMADKNKKKRDGTERWGCNTINPKFCKTCIFSKGDPPFEDRPEKAYCMIYSREQGVGKPYDVYYEGGLCEFYNDGKEDDVT